MGVIFPLNRKQLIEQHIASMQAYTIGLRARLWPWVSKAEVIKRVERCAIQMERAHQVMCEKERKIDRD